MTKRIKWAGDMANEPKSGVAIFNANGMVNITWDDGTTAFVPSFTISPRYGWTVLDA